MPRCSAAGLDFRIIPAGFNAPLEFLTGFTGGEFKFHFVPIMSERYFFNSAMHHMGCMAALNLTWFRVNSVGAIHESPLLRASLIQILIFAFRGGALS
jgi:hypothetical protein